MMYHVWMDSKIITTIEVNCRYGSPAWEKLRQDIANEYGVPKHYLRMRKAHISYADKSYWN